MTAVAAATMLAAPMTAPDGLVELGFTIVEADELLRDAPDDTPEALIERALRAARSRH